MPLNCPRLISHRAAIKTGLLQYFSTFLFFAVQIARRPFRQAHIHLCVRLNCVIDDLSTGTFLWSGPDRERKSSPRSQNATCFGTRLLGLRDMQQAKIYQHAIQAEISKWQILSIALEKCNIGGHLLCDGDHFFGEINSRWNSAQLLHRRGHIAGSTGDIQN